MHARKQLLQVSLNNCRVLALAQDLQRRMTNGMDEQTDAGLCLRLCSGGHEPKGAAEHARCVYLRT